MSSKRSMSSLRIVVAVAVAVAGGDARAADADPLARSIAASCAACHGTNGISVGGVPSLAGAPEPELAAKLRDYKTGRRGGTIMPQLARGYTDEQIDLAAAWFSAQPAPGK